jgi:hypothetical protein
MGMERSHRESKFDKRENKVDKRENKIDNREKIENFSKTVVGHSGNSDVDLTVNIDIDTKSIAFGMLCSLFAKGELSDVELEKGLRKLEELIDRDKRRKKHHSNSNHKPKLFEFPEHDEKRDDRHRTDRKKSGNHRNWL